MSCSGCNSNTIDLCSCDSGYNAFTVSTTNTTIADPMTITVSNTGQFTGKWAEIGQVVFIEGYGYYKCTGSTSTSITVAFPPSPFVGGAAYSLGSVDYDNSGSIPSGTKISPGGVKGATGPIVGNIEAINHSAHETTLDVYTDLFTPYSLDSNSLSSDGDSLDIEAYFYTKIISGTSSTANIKILIGGVSVTLNPVTSLEPSMDANLFPSMKIRLIVTRTSATLASIRAEIQKFPKIGTGTYANEAIMGSYTPTVQIFEILNTGVITWANANDISFQGKVTSAGNQAVKVGFYKIDNLQII